MSELSKMSGLELNKGIVESVFPTATFQTCSNDWNTEYTIFIVGTSANDLPDYCNNWNHLMPFVEQHRLIIVPYKDDLWEAYSEAGGFVVYNKSYLRAGAECLYMELKEQS